VNDAVRVRLVERIRDRHGVAQRFVDRHRAARDPLRQVLAVEELHDEELAPFVVADVVERADVGMLERGDRARLAVEALAELRVGGKGRRQDLDGDGAIEPGVARAVDLPHAAGADGIADFVWTETRPGGKAHERRADSTFTGAAGRFRRCRPNQPRTVDVLLS
jgi:hypothetical protein